MINMNMNMNIGGMWNEGNNGVLMNERHINDMNSQ